MLCTGVLCREALGTSLYRREHQVCLGSDNLVADSEQATSLAKALHVRREL
jgi:hypothetical protein